MSAYPAPVLGPVRTESAGPELGPSEQRPLRVNPWIVQGILVLIPALMAFAGSYAATQAMLAGKVDRVEFVTESAALQRRLDRAEERDAALALRLTDQRASIVEALAALRADVRAISCAVSGSPRDCRR